MDLLGLLASIYRQTTQPHTVDGFINFSRSYMLRYLTEKPGMLELSGLGSVELVLGELQHRRPANAEERPQPRQQPAPAAQAPIPGVVSLTGVPARVAVHGLAGGADGSGVANTNVNPFTAPTSLAAPQPKG